MNQKFTNISSGSRWIVIFCLVFAGEIIFSLPFHVARFFRPTLLDVFNLSNTSLGDVLAIYGITAMITYFPGGPLADRFSARKLLSISLAGTALGGIYFAQIPGKLGLSILFGFWGVSTILFFWAALIKATQEWGGEFAQGKAFGILDGGRGLIAAGAATFAVFLLKRLLNADPENSDMLQRTEALKMIIYFYTLLTFLSAILVWIFIPDTNQGSKSFSTDIFKGIKKVLSNKLVWLQAIIVVSSYCGYKGIDYYSLFSVEVLNMDEVSAASFVSNASYIRVVAAIGAGLLVDRFSASKVILYTFFILLICYIALTILNPIENGVNFILTNLILTFAAVYALRGIYFALLEETKVDRLYTGTAVGLISVIGYTPDVFFNSIAGRILDASPGMKGFHNFYLLLAGFSFIGLTSSLILISLKRRKQS